MLLRSARSSWSVAQERERQGDLCPARNERSGIAERSPVVPSEVRCLRWVRCGFKYRGGTTGALGIRPVHGGPAHKHQDPIINVMPFYIRAVLAHFCGATGRRLVVKPDEPMSQGVQMTAD